MSRSVPRSNCRRSCGLCRLNKSLCRRPRVGSSFALTEAAEERAQANWCGGLDQADECSCGECLDCLLYVDCEEAIDRRDCSCWRGSPHVNRGWLPTLAVRLAA